MRTPVVTNGIAADVVAFDEPPSPLQLLLGTLVRCSPYGREAFLLGHLALSLIPPASCSCWATIFMVETSA